MTNSPWALIIPMANEEPDFAEFTEVLRKSLDSLPEARVYLVTDRASKDRTAELCRELAASDPRFVAVWAPENRNVVDAYIRGYREALKGNPPFIIEMDAGLSHDPASLGNFVMLLSQGYDCVYGSRLMKGGSMGDSPPSRRRLSRVGTLLSNIMLGTRLSDMTSGYQGFSADVVRKFTAYPLRSLAHFYQTELKYLLRKFRSVEIPISYRAPSPRVSKKAITNSLKTLLYYFRRRITLRPVSIK